MPPTADTCIFQIGPYAIRKQPLFDNPAWAHYLIFLGDRLVGKQFSYPTVDDCKWHDRGAIYSAPSRYLSGYSVQHFTRRRGRPRKADAERELQEALQA